MSIDDTGVAEPGATRVEANEEPGDGNGRRFGRGGATRIESSAPAGTRIEDSQGPAGTRIEAHSGHAPSTVFDGAPRRGRTRVNMPEPLLARFEAIRDIDSRGAEADLLLVNDLQANEQRVLKLYRGAGDRIDQEMLELVRSAEAEHVVKLIDKGSSEGTWWELLEYCEEGSLADLIKREGPKLDAGRVPQIVDEIATALEHIHSLPCIHRDIKPANILVRTLEPFDLVLADFGLATVINATKEMRSASRTVEYSAPEAAAGELSPGRDWWSLGILIVEIATGRHPFTLEDGTPLEPRQIDAALATRSIDLSGVKDDRLRLLCRGLLQRDPANRWGAAQVNEWRAGGSPEVANDDVAAVAARVTPFPFFDKQSGRTQQFRNPVALATALASDWEKALAIVSGKSEDRRTTIAFHRFATTCENPLLEKILEDTRDSEPEAKLVRILLALDPSIPPTFRGMAIDRDGLARLARAQGTHDDAIRAISELGILRLYSSNGEGDEGADLAVCESDWHATYAYVEATLRANSSQLPSGTKLEQLLTRGLGIALGTAASETYAAEITAQAEQVAASENAVSQPWFASLARGRRQTESPIGHDVVVGMLGYVAERAGSEQAEARRREAEQRLKAQRAQFGAALRRSAGMVLKVGFAAFAAATVAALLLTVHVEHAPVRGGELAAAASQAAVAVGIAVVGILLAGLLFNTWVYHRCANRGYWHTLAPGALGLAIVGVPLLLVTFVAAQDGYAPPTIWPVAGVASALTAAWLLLLQVLRAEQTLDVRVRVGAMVGILAVAAGVLFAVYTSARGAVRTDYKAASAALARHVPLRGCHPVPYTASPKRDWVQGAVRCSAHGYFASFLLMKPGSALDSYTRARKAVTEPLKKRSDRPCARGGYEETSWHSASQKDAGRFLCFTARRRARVEWSFRQQNVYSAVWRHDTHAARLERWWKRNAAEPGVGG
jgi:serine/threonine protein kinase